MGAGFGAFGAAAGAGAATGAAQPQVGSAAAQVGSQQLGLQHDFLQRLNRPFRQLLRFLQQSCLQHFGSQAALQVGSQAGLQHVGLQHLGLRQRSNRLQPFLQQLGLQAGLQHLGSQAGLQHFGLQQREKRSHFGLQHFGFGQQAGLQAGLQHFERENRSHFGLQHLGFGQQTGFGQHFGLQQAASELEAPTAIKHTAATAEMKERMAVQTPDRKQEGNRLLVPPLCGLGKLLIVGSPGKSQASRNLVEMFKPWRACRPAKPCRACGTSTG